MYRTADAGGPEGGAGGGASGLWTPAYPGELPETKANGLVDPGKGGDWNPAEDYTWFYGNGQLHISEDHDLEDLASHAGVRSDHTGPVAMGHVHVDLGKATWDYSGNLSAQAISKILKDYTETTGWQWGGMVDEQGEPVGTGSEFAPVTSYYFAYTDGHLKLARKKSALEFCGGAAHVRGKEAFLYGHLDGMDAMGEWAADNGYTVVLSANDSGLQTIEDLEVDNNYGDFNNPQENYMEREPPDDRQPGGVFKCRDCGRLFPTWGLYLKHRTSEEPMGDNAHDPTKDTAWLDMDAPIPPHFHEQQQFYEASALPTVVLPENPGVGDLQDFGWRRPVMYAPHKNEVYMGFPGDYHTDLMALYRARHNEAARWSQMHEGWVGVPPDLEADNDAGYRGLRMRTGEEHLPALQQALAPHEPEAANLYEPSNNEDDLWAITGAAAPEWKDLVPAEVPFIYDIQNDEITVGNPGERHSAIPGQFTPGGIVEGIYEPGGNVHIRSMTNMPYTVRHMLELWYHTHPEMEIKSVDLQDDEGKQTKLAGQDIGTYIKSLVAADPDTFKVTNALRAAGGRPYIVGGAVRDALLGKAPNDLDVMVTGLPAEEVRRVLGQLGGKVDMTGKDFGVFRYNQDVEVALPRRERATGGGGHKDFIIDADHTMTPEEDLYRRDFTANAMAVDLDTGQLIDPFGGHEDLKSRTLRTLHTKTLQDDPLRTMRALTAHAKHGLFPDAETERQMSENGPGLTKLPKDRIRAELDKMFGYDDKGDHKDVDTASAIDLAHRTDLLRYFMPHVDRAMGWDQQNPHHEQDLGTHLVSVLRHTQKLAPKRPDLKLMALLHDIGKIDSRWTECRDCGYAMDGATQVCERCGSKNVSGHYYHNKQAGVGNDHEIVGADQAREWMTDTRYPNDRIDYVTTGIKHHMFPAFNTEKGARRFLNKVGDHADDLLTLRKADQGGKSAYPTDPSLSVDDHQKLIDQVREQTANMGNHPGRLQLAVNGGDLLAAGVPQGPQIGQMLQQLQEQVIENPQLNTKEALLGLVRAWQSQ